MMIRREVLDGTIFDDAYFMFGEDMDLCARVSDAGWEIVYSGERTITHYQGESFARQTDMEVLKNVHKRPQLFFQRRNGRLALFVYDVILLLAFVIRWFVFTIASWTRSRESDRQMATFSRQYVAIMVHMITARDEGPRE